MDFIQAAELKRYILKHFLTVLHIHDTCGGMYLSIDVPNDYVKEFIIIYCREMSIPLTVSEDGTSFYPGTRSEGIDDDTVIRIVFNKDQNKALAYAGDVIVGECSFSEIGEKWRIDHTYVEPLFRDRGIADTLVEKVVVEAKTGGKTITSICSYASKWLQHHGTNY